MTAITIHNAALTRIRDIQRQDGAIPWMEGGPLDPWNHVEAAMALSAGGDIVAAERAYRFLAETQCLDGSWSGDYGNAVPMADYVHLSRENAPQIRDTNFTAYCATGIWHHYLVTNEIRVLRDYWPMVRRAITHVLSLQQPGGEILWCAEAMPPQHGDALYSGCASIYKSLACAIAIGNTLGHDTDQWAEAQQRLGLALHQGILSFQRTLQNPQSFSMDWYYPVLTGLITGEDARAHLANAWDRFVVEGMGCRCVADQPWVTVAESCELALSLISIGENETAQEILSWQEQWRDQDGAYWMGYQFEEEIIWPEERPAWTSAAYLLAQDALMPTSATARLFQHDTDITVTYHKAALATA